MRMQILWTGKTRDRRLRELIDEARVLDEPRGRAIGQVELRRGQALRRGRNGRGCPGCG